MLCTSWVLIICCLIEGGGGGVENIIQTQLLKIKSIGSGTRRRIEGLHRRIAKKRMHTQSGCTVPGGDFLINELVK